MLTLLGVRNVNLKIFEQNFPKVKFVHRGSQLFLYGSDEDLEAVEIKLNSFVEHIDKFNSLSENNIYNILGKTKEEVIFESKGDEILVFGNKGRQVRAKTLNQRKMVDEVEKNDMLFAIGPAGTGKTYTAVALAVRALKNKEVRKIILTRPAVEAGENLGFLPGDLKEKLDPYLQPLYDGLRDMIPSEKLEEYLESGTIQIAPLAFMRGRTLDNAFVILD